MRRYFYLFLGFISIFLFGIFVDKDSRLPIEYAYADVPSGGSNSSDTGTNCNSSAPGATSTNGDDGSGTSASASGDSATSADGSAY
jgi:hypothetical protein